MHLNNIIIDHILFIRNAEFEFGPDSEQYEIKYKFTFFEDFKEEGLVLCVGLRVDTPTLDQDNTAPFSFDVQATGFFSFEEKPSEEILKQFKEINCPAIMFPYIRETVADAVRRSGYPPFNLPIVNFTQIQRQINK